MSEIEPEQARVEEARGIRSASYVWIAPITALAVALGVAWKHFSDLGPLVQIEFESGAGIEAGKTVITNHDVRIGKVETVELSPKHGTVIVTARMNKNIAPFLDDTTQFWVVRPRISAASVSGLETIFSGAYVHAEWSDKRGAPREKFTALSSPPLTPLDTPGARIRLRAADGGSMSEGAPVFFKRIKVGRIESKTLTEDGSAVEFSIFVNAPNHKRITTATRFWNASGFNLKLGADGAHLRVESLASLLQGGIAFDTVATNGKPVSRNATFRLYDTKKEAWQSIFDDPAEELHLSVTLIGSVRGLSKGAPVEYRGVPVGTVEDLAVSLNTVNQEVEITATLSIYPGRIGFTGENRTDWMVRLRHAVKAGLRAKIASANLLTGVRYIALVEQPDAPPATIDMAAKPYPRLPSVPSDLDAFTETAQSVLKKLKDIPIRQVSLSATQLLDNTNALIANHDMQKTPKKLAAVLDSANALFKELHEAGAARNLSQTLKATRGAANSIETASSQLPELLNRLNAVAKRAEIAVGALEPGSEFQYEAVAAIREVREAAKAVSALANSIDERPDILLRGK